MKKLFVFLFVIISITAKAEEFCIQNKVCYDIEIARTSKQKQKGLMFIKELPSNKGMLFDVRGNDNVSMWMKNTYISLDMLFIDCNYKIVDVHKKAKPLSLDHISSDEKFCYVLEVNAGEFDKYNLQIGDMFLFKE
jgi:uncharacterized membrane protein (UPF0127 family)